MKIMMTGILLASCISSISYAQVKEIALTIDDLPYVGTNSETKGNLQRSQDRFMKILGYVVDNHVPATGFVIAGSIAQGQWQLLEQFRAAGLGIGNHTYSHANLNHISAERYISEIQRSDKILAPIMTQPKYFRYPYLAEGRGPTRRRGDRPRSQATSRPRRSSGRAGRSPRPRAAGPRGASSSWAPCCGSAASVRCRCCRRHGALAAMCVRYRWRHWPQRR